MRKIYGPYEAPYWKRKWDSERVDSRKSAPAIDYGEVVCAASEWMYAENEFQAKHHGQYFSRTYNVEAYEKYQSVNVKEKVFRAVCMVTGIPWDAALQAARIEAKYYNDHNGSFVIDYAKLVRVLL